MISLNKEIIYVRIDEELMDGIRKIAELNSRSVNKEIEYIIKKRIEEYKKLEILKDEKEKTKN